MKPARIVLLGFLALLALPSARGQETQGQDEKNQQVEVKDKDKIKVKDKNGEVAAVTEAPAEAPLKVQVVLTEFDGAQKISSFPYSLNILGGGPHERHDAHLRYGVKVPIAAGANQFTYQDVGTNIDCHAWTVGDGQYRLDFSIERSSVSMPNSNGKATEWKPGDTGLSFQPLIRSFRDEFTLILKNGQTLEGTSAVDPITGHVQKVDVTLTVLK